MGLVIAYQPEQSGTTAKTSECQRAGPKKDVYKRQGSANAITARRVSRRFYLCGDGVSDVADGLGLVASRVAVCAGHQAHMVLRLLAEEYEP